MLHQCHSEQVNEAVTIVRNTLNACFSQSSRKIKATALFSFCFSMLCFTIENQKENMDLNTMFGLCARKKRRKLGIYSDFQL